MSVISPEETSDKTNRSYSQLPQVKITGLAKDFDQWLSLAKQRIFSIAAGKRIGQLSPRIMEVGYAKVLYAATQMGTDIENSKSFIFFAPDGTCSYNPIRTQRGFTYGGVLSMNFDGMMATNNSMPNGCGFSIYEIIDPLPDAELIEYLKISQERLGLDQLSQLGKGNHFAGVYYVNDPVTGEDTNRRWVVIHCSGHAGGNLLYHPDSWLKEEDGYHEVSTPHGVITLLEGEAKKRYSDQFRITDDTNAENRDITMSEIFDDHPWKSLESITHQGFTKDGTHIIGTQVHDGMMPIAFNPEEGLIAVKTIKNLTPEYLDQWKHGHRVRDMGLEHKFRQLNITPHGGGYEFRYPVKEMEIRLSAEGIHDFNVTLDKPDGNMSFSYFREIRDFMTYRRRAQVMKEVYKANLAEILFEMPGLIQVYPFQSIPGGSHG